MKAIITMLLAVVLCGCATVGRKLDAAKVDQIKKGESTRADVIRLIGSPDQITKDTSGKITMTYTYIRATTKPETFIPLIGAFAGGMNTQNQTVIVTIGEDGKVSEVISSYGATDVSQNASTGSKAKLDDVEKDKRAK